MGRSTLYKLAGQNHVLVHKAQRKGVFPLENRWKNTKTSEEGRHHVHETILQRVIKEAVHKAGFAKRATCYTYRHSFAARKLGTVTMALTERHS